MDENEEIIVESEAVSLEDSEDTNTTDVNTTNIIPFVMERYYRADDYRELDEQHQYEVALDQWVKGEIKVKPEQPFTVFIQ